MNNTDAKQIRLDKSFYKKLRGLWILVVSVYLCLMIPLIIFLFSFGIPTLFKMVEEAINESYRLEYTASIYILYSFSIVATASCVFLIYKVVRTILIPKYEKQIIQDGEIVEGKVLKFIRFGVRNSSSAQSHAFNYDKGSSYYKAKYQYSLNGNTITRKSPAYFSVEDKNAIECNGMRVNIAVLKNKSCITHNL